MSASINFFSEDIDFELSNKDLVVSWLKGIAVRHGFSISEMNYVFVSDEYLLVMNKEHLDHDTYTDILTFPLMDPDSKELTGDIFISLDRVKDNADQFNVSFEDELHRVMAHGLLHLVGIDDKDEAAKAEMRKEEDFALSLRDF